jgi:hypothetical protein
LTGAKCKTGGCPKQSLPHPFCTLHFALFTLHSRRLGSPPRCRKGPDLFLILRDIRVTIQSQNYNGHAALHGVTAEHHEAVVFLQGRVPSFYMQQIAQEVARKVHGV